MPRVGDENRDGLVYVNERSEGGGVDRAVARVDLGGTAFGLLAGGLQFVREPGVEPFVVAGRQLRISVVPVDASEPLGGPLLLRKRLVQPGVTLGVPTLGSERS